MKPQDAPSKVMVMIEHTLATICFIKVIALYFEDLASYMFLYGTYMAHNYTLMRHSLGKPAQFALKISATFQNGSRD